MKIRLKTTGLMREYMPANAVGSRAEMVLQVGTKVSALVRSLQIPESQDYMLSLNGSLLSRDQFSETLLSDGDELILMAPITAG